MNIIGGILIAVSIALIVLVVLQEGKNNRLSGAISGASSDTYLGKSKAATKQKKLANWTVVAAVVLAVLVLAMHIMSLSKDNYEYQEPSDTSDVVDTVDTTDGTDADAGEETTGDTEGADAGTEA